MSESNSLDNLTLQSFQALIGEAFAVNGVDAVLELFEVTQLQSPSPRAEPFSLLFRSTTHRLTQSTFLLSHPRLGEFNLFIVPIEPDANGAKYQAIFN